MLCSSSTATRGCGAGVSRSKGHHHHQCQGCPQRGQTQAVEDRRVSEEGNRVRSIRVCVLSVTSDPQCGSSCVYGHLTFTLTDREHATATLVLPL